jgi:3-hydroxymyristoyl/3-hydroxydecanoyl-(acyl carrier protein) dehydratase
MRFRYDRAGLIDLLPQRPPFLFLDSVAIDGNTAVADYRITGDEAKGHFAGHPVFPASLMIEGLGQLACAWLLAYVESERGPEAQRQTRLLFAGIDRIKCRRICVPGEVLTMRVENVKVREPLAYFNGRVAVADEKTASCELLTLSFGTVEAG